MALSGHAAFPRGVLFMYWTCRLQLYGRVGCDCYRSLSVRSKIPRCIHTCQGAWFNERVSSLEYPECGTCSSHGELVLIKDESLFLGPKFCSGKYGGVVRFGYGRIAYLRLRLHCCVIPSSHEHSTLKHVHKELDSQVVVDVLGNP